MNHKTLVPPLELCKLIPDGEFADSAFLYIIRHGRNGKIFNDLMLREDYDWSNQENYPAPTQEEIMAAMPYCRVYKKTNGLFIAVNEKTRINAMQGATAALKVWLKLKGIEE